MDFALPEIGEGVYEAELVRWLVKPGEAVKRGQTLVEVMTDKATMELPSPFSGTITALHVEPGQRIKVGEVILDFTPAEQPALVGSNATAETPVRSPERTVADVNRNGPVRRTTRANAVKAAPSVRLVTSQNRPCSRPWKRTGTTCGCSIATA